MSPDGANLVYLQKVFGQLEGQRLPNMESSNEVASVSSFVLASKMNYPYRLFRIPSLKTFFLNYILNVKSWKLFLHYLKNTLDLPALMPFLTPGHSLYQQRNTQSWRDQLTINNPEQAEGLFEFFTLWGSGIDVKISINKIKLLVIQHSMQFLMMNRLKKNIVEMILAGLSGGARVSYVHLDHVEVDLNLIPTDHLERLVLHRVKTKCSIQEYVKKCRKLRLFYCMDMNGELIDFTTDLHFGAPGGPSLIQLGLGNARLTCSNMPATPIKGSYVTLLDLKECQCDSSFFHAIPNLFPHLANLKFFGVLTLKMLNRFLLIKELYNVFVWKLETVPQLVARADADSSIREVSVKKVQVVKQKIVNNRNRQFIISVEKETVMNTIPWKNCSGKISDQIWSYDLHATEEPNVTKAMKKFLFESSSQEGDDFVDFNQPICEAFVLRKHSHVEEDLQAMKYNFLMKELYSEPCCSRDLQEFLLVSDPEEGAYWRSTMFRQRNYSFPIIFLEDFGLLYPYPNVELFNELDGMATLMKSQNVDAADEALKHSLDHFSEVYLLE